MTRTDTERRYELDWLRCLAFAVLILYHLGMYYVADWGWHVKTDQPQVWLQDLMIFSNPWRMSLLFLLGGMALSLICQKYQPLQLLGLRSKRLLIPLLFTMAVLVVPQVYFEALSQQLIEPGYLKFWQQYINPWTSLLPQHHSPIGLLTWNHAWFIPYLWCYSLLALAALPLLQWLVRQAQHWPAWLALLLVLLVLAAAWYWLKPLHPSTHALVDDWYNHAKYLPVFLAGFVLARQNLWWGQLLHYRRLWLLLALLSYALIIADRHQWFDSLEDPAGTQWWLMLIVVLVVVLNHWCFLLAILGYAGRYLAGRNSSWLAYCNQAILPWYLLHQTLIIVFAMTLKPLALAAGPEALLILLCTLGSGALAFEGIRRSRLSCLLFGLNPPALPKSVDVAGTRQVSGAPEA
ncbi:acyltransferase family protein [Rheinheimera marina]|uniref:Acyltransferase family protein n=1 Tax=Rheinheimera marina TaxID=1774958 RepID=A0ABV9JHC9_9GAMM